MFSKNTGGSFFNSTASVTEAASDYRPIPIPTSESISPFLDNPLGSCQSILLVLTCLAAVVSCTVFLALRYIEVLRLNIHDYGEAPLDLEAQKAKKFKHLDNPRATLTSSINSSRSCLAQNEGKTHICRRLRFRYARPKHTRVGGVEKGMIALRRASRAGSTDLRDGLAEAASV